MYRPLNGLPQGSIIAPKLFNIYLNQVWELIEEKHPGITKRTIAYADDVAIVGITRNEW